MRCGGFDRQIAHGSVQSLDVDQGVVDPCTRHIFMHASGKHLMGRVSRHKSQASWSTGNGSDDTSEAARNQRRTMKRSVMCT